MRPFAATIRRGGKSVTIGHFATPEAAALNVARAFADDPDGAPKQRKAAKRKAPAVGVAAMAHTSAGADPEYLPSKSARPTEPVNAVILG